MIKLIIFDLDGVLVETKELHYHALNDAILDVTGDAGMVISLDEHIQKYDGLPTNKKLQLLSRDKGLPNDLHGDISNKKQKLTSESIKRYIKRDERLVECFRMLKSDGYKIYVASNSIRDTVKMILLCTGLMEYVDFTVSNEDVKNPKPNPEMYLRSIIDAGVSPSETLIVEDSPRGIEAAQKSMSNILIVKNPSEVSYDNIKHEINKNKSNKMKLKMNKLNVLIPMAGEGSRFKTAGYTFPKPLIDVNNKTMIHTVVDSLCIDANYIYLVRSEHYEKYNMKSMLNFISPGCKIVKVDGLTDGAACTTLLAKEHIDNDDQLLIVNSDQYIEWDPINFYYKINESKADGCILTFNSTHPKWSYVKVGTDGNVYELAEKKGNKRHSYCRYILV